MFKTELQSAEQEAGGVARLCCQLSDSEAGAPVLWLKEGVELHRSPKYEMRRQGATCELLIHGLEAKDVGEYSCMAGSQKTLAFLKVKGERPLPHRPPAAGAHRLPQPPTSCCSGVALRPLGHRLPVLTSALLWAGVPTGEHRPAHRPAFHPHPPPAGGAARPGPLSLSPCLS